MRFLDTRPIKFEWEPPKPSRPLKYRLEVHSASALEEMRRVRDACENIRPPTTAAGQERFEKTWGKPCSRQRLDTILAVAPIFGVRLLPVPGNPGLLAWYDEVHRAFRTVSKDALFRTRNLRLVLRPDERSGFHEEVEPAALLGSASSRRRSARSTRTSGA